MKEKPSSALLIVDIQRDFCEGGALGVSGGERVASNVAAYLRSHADDYDLVVATRDWHIDPGDHFAEDPDFLRSWPPHCVAHSEGADFHPAIREVLDAYSHQEIRKGMHAAAYSAFEGELQDGTPMRDVLASHQIGHVDIVGLCTDYCVAQTALHAIQGGLRTRVLLHLTTGVHPDTTRTALKELDSAGIEVLDSTDPRL